MLAKALADSAGKPRWIRAYAQPIETETSFVPVDSDLERDALAKLRCIAKVQETHNRKYTILKPVFCIYLRDLCILTRQADWPSLPKELEAIPEFREYWNGGFATAEAQLYSNPD